MKKIGLLSDTHGYFDPQFKHLFADCDEIWHAGDIGSVAVLEEMEALHTTRVVYCNIDGHEIRIQTKEYLYFTLEGVSVAITHIAGRPGKYTSTVKQWLSDKSPDLFICGHSHILGVMRDKQYGFMYMNPGAAGIHGLHTERTALLFKLDNGKIKDLELIKLGKRGKI